MSHPESSAELAPDQRMIFEADTKALKNGGEDHDIQGLEGRVKFGLDPAGMLVVKETLPLVKNVAESLGTDVETIWPLIAKLHKEGPWESAEDLSAASESDIRAYIVLAAACQEVGWPGHTPKGYLEDKKRVIEELGSFTSDSFDERKASIISRITIDHMAGDGNIPVAEGDPALPLSLQGYKGCVAKNKEDLYAQTTLIPDALLEKNGLVRGFAEVYSPQEDGFVRISLDDPKAGGGRIVWVESGQSGKDLKDMEPAAKRIFPGYVLTYKNEDLAVELVRSSIEDDE